MFCVAANLDSRLPQRVKTRISAFRAYVSSHQLRTSRLHGRPRRVSYLSARTRDIVPAMPVPVFECPARLLLFRAMLIRKRGQMLGYVEAADRAAAELAAVT